MIKVFPPSSKDVNTVRSTSLQELIVPYLRDESNILEGFAERVFFPKDLEDVSAILRWANEKRVKVTVSGGGTGLTGGRVPRGGAVISTEDMVHLQGDGKHRVKHWGVAKEISLDIVGDEVLVPAGVLLEDLWSVISSYNLYYPPNPTERGATLGGNVATNASGGRSFKFGSIRPWVLALDLVLPTGHILHIKRGEHLADEKGIFHFEYPEGVLKVKIPTYRTPNVKNASGIFSKDGMDVVDLFIGCEGILGVFACVRVKLYPFDGDLFSSIVFFAKEEDALSFVGEVRELSKGGEAKIDASTLDYFDPFALAFMRNKYPDIPKKSQAAVFVEQFIKDEDELVDWEDLFQKHRYLVDWSALGGAEYERIRDFRHGLPEAINEEMRRRGLKKMALDVAVPFDKVKDLIDTYRRKTKGFTHIIFGHIGDGNLHMNVLAEKKSDVEEIQRIYSSLYQWVVSVGGTVSAEHGVGKKVVLLEGREVPLLEVMYGKEGLMSIADIKNALDTQGILNVGNVISEEYLKF